MVSKLPETPHPLAASKLMGGAQISASMQHAHARTHGYYTVQCFACVVKTIFAGALHPHKETTFNIFWLRPCMYACMQYRSSK